MLRRLAHVGVDQQHALIGLGHGDGEVAGDRALAVAGRRRRDGDGLGIVPGEAEVQRGAQRADRPRPRRPRRVGDEAADVGIARAGAQVRQHAQDGQLQDLGHFVDAAEAMVEQVAEPCQAEAAEPAQR